MNRRRMMEKLSYMVNSAQCFLFVPLPTLSSSFAMIPMTQDPFYLDVTFTKKMRYSSVKETWYNLMIWKKLHHVELQYKTNKNANNLVSFVSENNAICIFWPIWDYKLVILVNWQEFLMIRAFTPSTLFSKKHYVHTDFLFSYQVCQIVSLNVRKHWLTFGKWSIAHSSTMTTMKPGELVVSTLLRQFVSLSKLKVERALEEGCVSFERLTRLAFWHA